MDSLASGPNIYLENGRLGDYLGLLKETGVLKKSMDEYLDILHQDERQAECTFIFQQAVETNSLSLRDRELQEKVDLLFKSYVREELAYLYTTTSFQKAYQDIIQATIHWPTADNNAIENKIYSICQNYIYKCRSLFIRYSLAKALNIDYETVRPNISYLPPAEIIFPQQIFCFLKEHPTFD